jgi:hypothetical protein
VPTFRRNTHSQPTLGENRASNYRAQTGASANRKWYGGAGPPSGSASIQPGSTARVVDMLGTMGTVPGPFGLASSPCAEPSNSQLMIGLPKSHNLPLRSGLCIATVAARPEALPGTPKVTWTLFSLPDPGSARRSPVRNSWGYG